MDDARLSEQIKFLTEADRLKSVVRRNRVLNGERAENSAEHSWQLALMAVVLSEYAAPEVDVSRVIKMLLVHDLVEIDAGDTFAFDRAAVLTQRGREEEAAARVFGLLPPDQAEDFRALWEEFEARRTPEARFARAMDNLGGGVLPNCHHRGGGWREAGVSVERVRALNAGIALGSPALWEYAEGRIDEAARAGFLDGAE